MSSIRKVYLLERCEPEPAQSDDKIDTARLEEHIKFNLEDIDKLGNGGISTTHYDLIVLSASIEFADKLYRRSTQLYSRNICVNLPMHEVNAWDSIETHDRLHEVLAILTGDNWKFEFRPYKTSALESPNQKRLFIEQDVDCAMAFSDGIDSLCVYEIYSKNQVCRRVHVGNHQRNYNSRHDYVHIPFKVKPKRVQEHGGRTRAFKFSALTSIVANLSNAKKVIVTESGQSSIGPPILQSRNIFPDYRCHPKFFRSMEKFLEPILGAKFSFEQPRLFHTKGETIQLYKSMKQRIGLDANHLKNTRSCSLRRSNVSFCGGLHQCGVCGACLLRRMSMFVGGIEDPNDYYTVSDLSESRLELALHPAYKNPNVKYLTEIADINFKQLYDFANLFYQSDPLIDPNLSQLSVALKLPFKKVKEKFQELVKRHAMELNSFMDHLGERSFLREFIKNYEYA